MSFTEVSPNQGVAHFRFAEALQVNYTNNPRLTDFPGQHRIATAEANPPEGSYRGSPPTAPLFSQGDSWYNRRDYDDVRLGSFAYSAGLMHETGHNLGLKHGHVAQQGHGQTFPKLPRDHNSYEYSVMTYAQFVGDNPRNGDDAPDQPTTYMQNDIAALQYLYGANYGYKSGNTHYAWSPKTGECFIDGTGQGRPIHNYVLQTVWDGGVDTYDFSKYSHGVHVDLSPGAWSRTTPGQLANLGSQGNGPDHFARGSIANALLHEGDTRALIENVIGSRGNDSITGNRADNVIGGGGGGRDILEGLGGADAFVFTARPIATNVDRIADFRTIDTLRLDDDGFRALDLGRLATSAFETIGSGDARVDGSAGILYDRGKGDLYYDPDGGGANGRVKFAQIDNHARLGADDVLVV